MEKQAEQQDLVEVFKQMSEAIKVAENKLKLECCTVQAKYGALSWMEVNDRYRITDNNGKPLSACKLQFRIDNFKDLNPLIDEVRLQNRNRANCLKMADIESVLKKLEER